MLMEPHMFQFPDVWIFPAQVPDMGASDLQVAPARIPLPLQLLLNGAEMSCPCQALPRLRTYEQKMLF